MELEKKYHCDLCEKKYDTRGGLWKHTQSKHNDTNIKKSNNVCKYCKKDFSDRKARWRHEKTICKSKLDNSNLDNSKNIINNIKKINNSTIGKMSTDNSTFNDNSTNIQNQTINITINRLGCEDINVLTQDNIEEIINNGLDCAIKLIELINFNKEHPQNHSFCTTSLNNKYTSVFNTETNEIEKKRKIDVFDNVLMYALNHIDMLKDRIMDKRKRKKFAEKIKELELNMCKGDKGYRKIFIEQLNAISYNNKKMINETWDNYLKNILVMNL